MESDPNAEFELREMRETDNPLVSDVIDQCLAEFGAGGPGFVNADPEFRRLFQVYQAPRSAYFVVTRGDRVMGGGGVGPLRGGPSTVCELQKMYLLQTARGHGLGQRLLDRCMTHARAMGYSRCYLETLQNMSAARALYEKNGFRPVARPMGTTGHFGCDAWYLREL